MKVNFKLDEEDFYDFDFKNLENFPKAKRILNFQRYVVPLIYLIVGYLFYRFKLFNKNQSIIFTIIIVLGWIIFYPKYVKRGMKKRTLKILRENPSLLYERTMELNENGIFEIIDTEDGEQTVLLGEKILGYNERDGRIYINLLNETAYIIPSDSVNRRKEFFDKLSALKVSNES